MNSPLEVFCLAYYWRRWDSRDVLMTTFENCLVCVVVFTEIEVKWNVACEKWSIWIERKRKVFSLFKVSWHLRTVFHLYQKYIKKSFDLGVDRIHTFIFFLKWWSPLHKIYGYTRRNYHQGFSANQARLQHFQHFLLILDRWPALHPCDEQNHKPCHPGFVS